MTKVERSRLWRLAAAGVLASAVVAVGAAPSSAVHDLGLFELDNNAVNGAAAGDDWNNVLLGNGGASIDNTGVLVDPAGTTIFTTGGSKDDLDTTQWRHTSGSVPDKDEITDAYAASYVAADGDRIIYFGMDRFAQNGSANIGFWFFQNEVALNPNGTFSGAHTVGDVLILSEFTNGGAVSSIKVYEWVGTGGDTNGTLNLLFSQENADCDAIPAGTDHDVCATVNGSPTASPWAYTPKQGPSGTFPAGAFFEGGINLTELFPGAVPCFSSFLAETRSSPSIDATLKDFVLGSFGECATTLTTQSSITGSTSIGTGSVSVSDSAAVSVQGISTWNGTVQFHLRGPIGSPLEVSTDIGAPVPVSNTTPTVQSATATVTAAGDYCWSAHFTSATNGVPDSDDDGTNECFTVTPVRPALPTTAGPDVELGNPVTDTVVLSGTSNQPGTPAINPTTAGAAAGGSITFTLLKSDCTTLATGTGTNPQSVPVNGDGTYGPVSFTPDAIGTYHWTATYTPAMGDPNNLGSTFNGDCSDANEDVVVLPVPSSLFTAQSFIPNDSATVSAPRGGALAGSVTFAVFESSDCSGTAIFTQTVPVSGGSPQTVSTTNTTVSTTAATVSWLVSYDSTNPAQRDIPANCLEKTALTIDNGGTISSP